MYLNNLTSPYIQVTILHAYYGNTSKKREMTRNTSIFYKLTGEDENASTELLCNLFRIKYFRDVCLEFLGIPKEVCDTITIDNISTQTGSGGAGILDILIKNEHCYYIIENKIRTGTGLTAGQQTSYPKHLQSCNYSNKKLIFIIPGDYQHKENINALNNEHPGLIEIHSWEDLLSHLNKKELGKEAPLIKESLHYFERIISLNSPVDTKLTPYEVALMYSSKEVFDILLYLEKMYGILDKASQKVVKELGDKFYAKNKMERFNSWECGKYIYYNNAELAFIGFSYRVWDKNNGDYVFGVAFLKEQLNKISIDEKNYPYIDDDYWVYFKLDRKILLEENQEEHLVTSVTEIINNVFLKHTI